MKVQLFRNNPPLYYNLEKWNITHLPLLLITGLSGSGKTTFAQKFAMQHHAICISFDVLKYYAEASKQSQKFLDLFLEKHPEIKKKISIQWSKTDNINSNDILFNYYCNLFYDFLVEYSLQNKKKIVLEGIQMFVRLHPSKSVEMPVIIIRSSSMNSFFNKFKRDYYTQRLLKSSRFQLFKNVINDIYMYYIKQRKLLNIYIDYLSTLHKNSTNEGDKTNE